jgi:nucleotide-binding universal stress UspA family protein
MSVFVAYVQSPEGRRALEAGAAEARLRGLSLHIATVLPHDVGDSPTHARRDMESAEAIGRHLDSLGEQVATQGIEVATEVLHGQSGEETRLLLDAMTRAGAELLVVGVRRRSPVGKLVLGSVSRDLLLEAPVPVLAVKADPQ